MRFKLFKPTPDGETLQRVITSPPMKLSGTESGSVRVKANGAIVVNRPVASSISSEEDDDDLDDFDNDERALFFESGSPSSQTTMGDCPPEQRDTASASLHLEQENRQLRRLLRQEYDKAQAWHCERNNLVENLSMAKKEIRFLQLATSHQSLLSPVYLSRRRSMGGDHDEALVASHFHTPKSKYFITPEDKLQILLVELEAMMQDEYRTEARTQQLLKLERELEQQILERDETIRQLRHDLKYHQLQHQFHKVH